MSAAVDRLPSGQNGAGTQDSPQVPGSEGQKSNRRVLKATIIRAQLPDQREETKQIEDEFLQAAITAGLVIEPPFDLLTLYMLPEYSTELKQCIDTMVTNIAGFGWKLEPRFDVSDPAVPEALKKEVRLEYIRAMNKLRNAVLGSSLTKLKKRTVDSRERCGNAAWEILRAASAPEGQEPIIDGFRYFPGYQLRIGRLDTEFTEIDVPCLEVQEDGFTHKVRKIRTLKRFRRYVQSVGGGVQLRWFKEFGDPRIIDCRDGTVADKRLPPEFRANEVFHWKLGTDRSPYGLVRFMGNAITIYGDRAADEVNYSTLENNAIPAMMILVSGANAKATQGTIDRLEKFATEIKGRRNRSQFVILEAESEGTGGLDTGASKIDVIPMAKNQTQDAMYVKFQAEAAKKLRSNFRFGGVFVGRAEESSRSTIEVVVKLGDEQVFRPERDDDDDTMNTEILPAMGIIYHRIVSRGPNVTDDQDLINVLRAAEFTGGMNPRISREITEDVLNKTLGPVRGVDPDVPMTLQVAEKIAPLRKAEVKLGAAGNPVRLNKDLGSEDGDGDLLPQRLRDELRDELRMTLRDAIRGELRELVREAMAEK
jgi:capsid portal protein